MRESLLTREPDPKDAARSDRDRTAAAANPQVGPHRARHLRLGERQISTETGRINVVVDDAESPLAWLARRRGRNGRALIEVHQLQAGERLRADFTRAQLMPRTTSSWDTPITRERRGGTDGSHFTDAMVAARQQVRQALERVGPEFSGLLLDVCCFLKRLEDIERERAWPARSAKVVLQLALDRLARHYGYAAQASGPTHAAVRTWLAADAELSMPDL